MLSYQHAFHAGNQADVHKHALLAVMLAYLTAKPKPLSYIETHAGRGLYRLDGAEALKTGEAAAGVARLESRFPAHHPYRRALEATRARFGASAYPGSPVLAAQLLRPGDTLHLAELHPGEHAALAATMAPFGAHVHAQDGLEMALALCPPTPRRGLLLIDPPYEIKADYETLPRRIGQIARKWNVGIIALWYPILAGGPAAPPHLAMQQALCAAFPTALCHERRFGPARPGHRMVGSGMLVINPPYGLAEEATLLDARLDAQPDARRDAAGPR